MAAFAHLGIGLAAKPLAPNLRVGWLILGGYALDIVWGLFFAAGLETNPADMGPNAHPPWWEHSLLMAVLWSILFGAIAMWFARRSPRRRHIGAAFGLIVFSHWVLDWITHPMTAAFPGDKGLPLAFGNSAFLGLGLYRHSAAIWPTEIGFIIAGATVYLAWSVRRNGRKDVEDDA